MVKGVNYNSLKKELYSKKENITKEETKKEPSKYKLIKERLTGDSFSEQTPSEKADTLAYAFKGQKGFYQYLRVGKTGMTQPTIQDLKKWSKSKAKNYSDKDIEEAIVNGLHELDSKGVQLTAGGKRSMYYKGKHMTKYSDIDPRWREFTTSFDNIKKLETILFHKRFLKKHGITSDEIKKYKNTFKKRVGRVLKNAVEFARNKETQEITERMLNYAKKEGLIDYKKTGLEKSLAVISLGAVVAGLFFLSPNLTGNVIGSMTKTNSNFLGVGLFMLGIVGTFVFKRK